MSAKTPFAGLEALGPGEPLSTDGYAFQAKNPYIIDLLLKIGAVLHRHDAHAAMANPTQAPTVAARSTGGSIEAGTPVYVAYTLTDPQGGETLPTAPVQVTIGGGYQDPTGAPDATVDFAAGSMLASTPLYAVSVTDGLGGETALGPPISVTVPPAANAEVVLSGLTAIANQASNNDAAAGWRLWRSMDGGTTWDLMTTGPAATDTWTDDGTIVGDCSVTPPVTGTTGNTGSFAVTVPTGQPAEAQFINIYACTDGAFTNPCLLATLPITDAGVEQDYGAIAVQAGVPPAVSTCIGGANQIDPDTDILNWPWKMPVATVADLPTTGNDDGDTRIVRSNYSLYTWDANTNAWGQLVGSGGAPNVTDGTTTVDAPSELEFAGGGGGTVTVTNPSPGVALVTVSAPTGGGGGLSVTDGVTTLTPTTLTFVAGVGLGVGLIDNGGGQAELDIFPSPAAPNQIDGDYTFGGADDAQGVDSNHATGATFTVPTNASFAFKVGAVIAVCQMGAGQVTIAGQAGVTVDAPGGLMHTKQQFSTIYLRQHAVDHWVLSGDLA